MSHFLYRCAGRPILRNARGKRLLLQNRRCFADEISQDSALSVAPEMLAKHLGLTSSTFGMASTQNQNIPLKKQLPKRNKFNGPEPGFIGVVLRGLHIPFYSTHFASVANGNLNKNGQLDKKDHLDEVSIELMHEDMRKFTSGLKIEEREVMVDRLNNITW